jgi:thiosulfate/3-mercaptopyruvate sulfurtransferase
MSRTFRSGPLGARRICLAAVLLMTTASAARASSPTPMLVSVEWLASHLHDPDLVLLHVGGREAYDTAHVAGARFIQLSDLSTPHNMDDGSLMLELPPARELRDHLEALGISDDSRIIVYFGDDWLTPATRVVFTLDYLGLGDRTSLLNGGMAAWQRAGHTVTADVPTPRRGHLADRPTRPLVVDADYVRALPQHAHVRLVDARAAAFYDGVQEASGRRGHIPGAVNIPFTSVVDNQLMIRADTLALRFRAAGVLPGDTVVAYCHIGQQATAVVFAARLLGFPALLYDGSMQDWARHPDFPVERKSGQAGGNP